MAWRLIRSCALAVNASASAGNEVDSALASSARIVARSLGSARRRTRDGRPSRRRTCCRRTRCGPLRRRRIERKRGAEATATRTSSRSAAFDRVGNAPIFSPSRQSVTGLVGGGSGTSRHRTDAAPGRSAVRVAPRQRLELGEPAGGALTKLPDVGLASAATPPSPAGPAGRSPRAEPRGPDRPAPSPAPTLAPSARPTLARAPAPAGAPPPLGTIDVDQRVDPLVEAVESGRRAQRRQTVADRDLRTTASGFFGPPTATWTASIWMASWRVATLSLSARLGAEPVGALAHHAASYCSFPPTQSYPRM